MIERLNMRRTVPIRTTRFSSVGKFELENYAIFFFFFSTNHKMRLK